ncbi:hypothetical protein HS7_08980 [Sulfolobales archaeon HS-7]|nr:hypothetical protein HS7_08980 [Sulfolobales archaeon HS-7]
MSTDRNYRILLRKVKKQKVRLWRRVFEELSKSRRERKKHVINLYKIDNLVNDGDTVIVLGKVLATGELKKKVNVYALNFSKAAIEKIRSNGGDVGDIEDALNTLKSVKGVVIMR